MLQLLFAIPITSLWYDLSIVHQNRQIEMLSSDIDYNSKTGVFRGVLSS